VVFGGYAGTDLVGLAILPRWRPLLQVEVINQNGHGVEGLALRLNVRGTDDQSATATGIGCGSGCYRASVAVRRPRLVTITFEGMQTIVAMPRAWPPPPAALLVERATRIYKALHTFVIHDELGDGHAEVHTLWRIVAPNELAYDVRGGGESIIIGSRRWDRPDGSTRWLEEPQVPIKQPTPFWVDIVDARLLGVVDVDGRSTWKVSFYDPATPGWYTLLIDRKTLRTLDMVMTAPAHFMHDTYSAFDTPLVISPPTRTG
jgi:hypothetical protein